MKLTIDDLSPANMHCYAPIVAEPVHGLPLPDADNNAQHAKIKKLFLVLIIGDRHSMQKSLTQELDKLALPIQIDLASSGDEALELISSNIYDFIFLDTFLDTMMAGIDGFEICTRIRKRAAMKKLPIIMVSAKDSPMDEAKAIISGCTTFITKPIDSEAFQKMIRRITQWVENLNNHEYSLSE